LRRCGGCGAAAAREHVARNVQDITPSLPNGWNGRSYIGGDHNIPVVQVANFLIPPDDDDYNSQAQAEIGTSGIVLSLLDFGSPQSWMTSDQGWTPSSIPLSIDASGFGPFEGGYTPSYARINFVVNGHAKQLNVAAASPDPANVAALVNPLLTLPAFA